MDRLSERPADIFPCERVAEKGPSFPVKPMRDSWQVDVARWLFVVYLFTLFVATSATVVVELLLLAGFLLARDLRSRFIAVLRQPLALMTLVLFAMISLGMLYGMAAWPDRLDDWLSWRRLLILPMAMAVFSDETWKRRYTWAFIGFCMLAAFLSYLTFLADFSIYHRFAPGIVVNNYATQGMFFAVAAFAAVIMARSAAPALTQPMRRVLIACAALLAANVIFVLTGRSGYLALMVLAAIAAWFLTEGRRRYVVLAAAPALVALLLALSPQAQQRIGQGIDEMRNYDRSRKLTSMGVRMVMWKNGLAIIKERPLAGAGLAGFREAYRQQVEGVRGWRGRVTHDPHNQYMRIAAEHGLPGLVVFLLFVASFFRQDVADPARILGLAVLLAWCATSFFSGHFSTFTEGRFLLVWCGAQLAQSETS